MVNISQTGAAPVDPVFIACGFLYSDAKHRWEDAMFQAWRWYGPNDPVSLDDIRQAGATTIVSALHDRPPGAVWTREAVATRKALIEETPAGRSALRWGVVESIPVPDSIKLQGAAAREAIDTWIASMEAVAANGIRTICYNFMPVLDWTRTDLDWPRPTGATALRFDVTAFAAFDIHVLKRSGASADYAAETVARAADLAKDMSAETVEALTATIAAGLPGTTSDALDLGGLREKLALYAATDATALRANLIAFLKMVTPAADKLGVHLTLHADDPPRPLFGLPRIAKNRDDYAALFDAVPSPANGMCFCTGSLGSDPGNDLPAMATEFGSRIHFVHLRAVKREADGSFFEADHLDGDVDMVAVIGALLAEDDRRPAEAKMPFRPDHGHKMLDDLHKRTNPGYSAIGRLKGLAELRGVMRALGHRAA
jgi:mannonate dehydratase